jgi:hypothetical protein
MPTDELLAVKPGEVALDHGAALGWAAALRDRLAAYHPIVAALREVTRAAVELYHVHAGYSCLLCGATAGDATYIRDPDGWHARTCPWALAQQTKGGEA